MREFKVFGYFLFISVAFIAEIQAKKGDNLDFANKLKASGYYSLAVEKFEKAISDEIVPKEESDQVYLSLFKIYEILANNSSAVDQAKYKAKAKVNFNKIKDKENSETKLEVIKSSLDGLRKIQLDFQKAANSKKGENQISDEKKEKLIKNARVLFNEVAVVADKIRLDARKWLEEYDELEEKDQKKKKNDKAKYTALEGKSNLQFGEACVLYANVVGYKDPDVRKWLIKMVENYQDFISEHFGSGFAMIGGLYLGEAYILLEKFKDVYGDEVSGITLGNEAFLESFNALNSLPSKFKTFKNHWLMIAYKKKTAALELIGANDEALKTYMKQFEWKAIDSVKPKSDPTLHNNLMGSWQQQCKLLQEMVSSGNNEKLADLYNNVTKGFLVTKKLDSPWHNNFKFLLGALPEPDGETKLGVEATFMRAKNYYNKAYHEKDEKKQINLLIEAANNYKNVLGMLASEPKGKRNEFYPEAAYKLGMSYIKLDNYLLALATFLKAVDRYPSKVYDEEKYPEIYKNIRLCAKNAKISASKRFKIGGRGDFDKSLYIKTLKIMSEKFPEEGGDPEYWIGYLLEGGGDYKEAKRNFKEVKPDSSMFLSAQYHIANCDYLVYSAKVAEEQKKEERDVLIKLFDDVIKIAGVKEVVTDNTNEKVWKKNNDRKQNLLYRSIGKVAKLYYQSGDFVNSKKAYMEQYERSTDPKAKKGALNQVIICDYKNGDFGALGKNIEEYRKLELYEGFTLENKKEDLANYTKMQANLVVRLYNELPIKRTAEEKEKAFEYSVQLGDLFIAALKESGEKDITLLTSAIGYYLQDKRSAEKALNSLKMYFEWNPDKPKFDENHKNAIGTKSDKWDEQIGSFMSSINRTKVKKTYSKFLDYLFDEVDYSKMTIAQIQKHRKNTGDLPRNYTKALRVFEELREAQGDDLNFKNKVFPELLKLESDLKAAKNYYDMRFKQGECYSILDRHGEAADVYKNIALYFVEYPSIRMELYKTLLIEGKEEGLKQAKIGLKELTPIVRNPIQADYSPLDFYSLILLKSKIDYALLKDKNDNDAVLDVWRYLRSNLFLDARYLSFEDERFKELKIPAKEVKKHSLLIDKVKEYTESKILVIINKGDSSLKNDSWDKLIGKKP